MITIVLNGLDKVQSYLAALPAQISSGLSNTSQSLAQMLTQSIQEKLSGEVLQSKTGALKNSVVSETEETANGITTQVSIADVPYAAIQEYGGTTKAHIIEVVNAKALAFAWQGKNVFFTRINHPGSVIPQRSYMRSSLSDLQDEIVSELTQSVSDTLNQ